MKKVITYGSFDLLHEGHYNLLKRAKALGDYLIVGVTTEQYDIYRGKMNVIDSLMKRVDNVRKTGFADEIIIEDHEGQKLEDIQKYEIDVFAIGSDWRGAFDYLGGYCEVVYLERTKGISSTLERNKRGGVVRTGIVGSGRIATRFITEAKYVSGLSVEGVFNPHMESAQAFAEQHELNFFTHKYDSFLGSVDAVYVASPHETHYAYAKQAIEGGKHVLCEKPMVLNSQEARELFALARGNDVVLMEAVKTAYAPSFLNLLAIAKGGRLGVIRDVEATFTKLPTSPSCREMTSQVGGSFTELGSYPLMAIFRLLGHDYMDLRFESIYNENGMDVYTKAYFRFDNAMATAKTGLGVKSEGQLLISGTKGYILAKSPWWLTKSFELCFEDTEQNESFYMKFLGSGLRYEAADFIRQIWDKESNNFKLSVGDSIAMAGVMEGFLLDRANKA